MVRSVPVTSVVRHEAAVNLLTRPLVRKTGRSVGVCGLHASYTHLLQSRNLKDHTLVGFGAWRPSPHVGLPGTKQRGAIVLNLAIVIGHLAKDSQVRQLPSGLSLASFDLLVPRPGDQASETVPIALFDAPAYGHSAPDYRSGQELVVVGRVRRRFFRVSGATQSRTEVVADRVLPVAQTDDVRSALTSVVDRLALVAGEIGGTAT